MILEVREGEKLRDSDGTRLLFKRDIAQLAGVKVATITHHDTAAKSARRGGRTAHFPAHVTRVRYVMTKRNGQKLTVITPVWREDVIARWLANRLGPGGRALGRPPAGSHQASDRKAS